MGTPITAEIRRIVFGERATKLSDREKFELLEARSAQIKSVMKYMDPKEFTWVPIPRSVTGPYSMTDQSPMYELGNFHIVAPGGFTRHQRGLYFNGFSGSKVFTMWGLTVLGAWMTIKVHLTGSREDKDPVDRVEVEFPERKWFAKYYFTDAWIDLSRAVDAWVKRREGLLAKARETQIEMFNQDSLVAPFMKTVTGLDEEFVRDRA